MAECNFKDLPELFTEILIVEGAECKAYCTTGTQDFVLQTDQWGDELVKIEEVKARAGSPNHQGHKHCEQWRIDPKTLVDVSKEDARQALFASVRAVNLYKAEQLAKIAGDQTTPSANRQNAEKTMQGILARYATPEDRGSVTPKALSLDAKVFA